MNSETECGFSPQYDEIQDLREMYGVEDFNSLDFPCIQSGSQMSGRHKEIHSFCSTRFEPTEDSFVVEENIK